MNGNLFIASGGNCYSGLLPAILDADCPLYVCQRNSDEKIATIDALQVTAKYAVSLCSDLLRDSANPLNAFTCDDVPSFQVICATHLSAVSQIDPIVAAACYRSAIELCIAAMYGAALEDVQMSEHGADTIRSLMLSSIEDKLAEEIFGFCVYTSTEDKLRSGQ